MRRVSLATALLLSAGPLPAMEDIFPIEEMPPAPVLSPEDALKSFRLEPGFRLELVACEPMIEDPVVVRFDADGRMWVLELRGYMPNLQGKGEDEPVGRIVILEDSDGDGRMDKSKVFLDGLRQVRAFSLFSGGLLYCEPPFLYFVTRDGNDQPGEKVLIDRSYASGGNVEHKANGLVRGLDNWIYSAKSDRRYRYDGVSWRREKTLGRGQWGICQDDYGRLFYNSNSSGLRGDSVAPSLLRRNPAYVSKEGQNRGVGSNRVFPVRPTAGINRGYKPGMLDDEGRLRNFTGASGPCVYRGDQFPGEFRGNGFTPEPCGNLVKRFIIEEKDERIGGRDAYDDRDFLASTDERFRPVSIENGPDGCMYVVDMYRGIIQHRTYVTPYLKRHIAARGLEKPIGLGRIYRIVAENREIRRAPRMSGLNDRELALQLTSANGWTRDTAQRLLVERAAPASLPWLEKLASNPRQPMAQIHALWALEGMGVASVPAITAAAEVSGDPKVLATVIRHAPVLAPDKALKAIGKLVDNPAHDVQLALAMHLGEIDDPRALEMLADVLAGDGTDRLFRDAALSGLAGREKGLLAVLEKRDIDPSGIREQLVKAGAALAERRQSETDLQGAALMAFTRGKKTYATLCMACHGEDGEGLIPIAPPLKKSEWVTGDHERLAHIVLSGLQGPIEVAGVRYAPPDIQPVMPGIGANPEITDEDLAEVLTYVRNAWGNAAGPVVEADIESARKSAKEGIYSVEELVR